MAMEAATPPIRSLSRWSLEDLLVMESGLFWDIVLRICSWMYDLICGMGLFVELVLQQLSRSVE